MSVGKWFENAGKSIGTFFSRDVPNVVTKEIPKFFTKTIPSLGKPETYRPSLVSWRQSVATAQSELATNRALFFEQKAQLADALARYRAMSEDYGTNPAVDAASRRFESIRDAQWNDPANAAQKTWQDVDKSVRTVLGSITLGLTEPLWAGAEAHRAKQEIEFLKARHAKFVALSKRITSATQSLRSAREQLEVSIVALEAKGESVSALAAARNEATSAESRDAETLVMARQLLADGLAPAQVALFTGLAEHELEAMAPIKAGTLSAQADSRDEAIRALAEDGLDAGAIALAMSIDEATAVAAIGTGE